MVIKVVELCWVDYIHEEKMDEEPEGDEKITSKRAVFYESKKETLLEAFQDYQENFDSDNILNSYDDFDGGCLDTLKILSVEEIEEEQ